jgi:protein-S-isoprenylcysteine O-methyltransferase Ste14
MKITKYQRLFGVGPIGFMVDFVLLFLLGLLGKKFGHSELSSDSGLIRLCGLIVIVLWTCWQGWCLATLKAWVYDNKLCTHGPFRFVRHPIYAGVIFILTPGIALIFNSWTMLLCPFFLFPILSILVRREETMMNSCFGEDYVRYASRTGRLFPRIF